MKSIGNSVEILQFHPSLGVHDHPDGPAPADFPGGRCHVQTFAVAKQPRGSVTSSVVPKRAISNGRGPAGAKTVKVGGGSLGPSANPGEDNTFFSRTDSMSR